MKYALHCKIEVQDKYISQDSGGEVAGVFMDLFNCQGQTTAGFRHK